jgi:hypothetical protein
MNTKYFYVIAFVFVIILSIIVGCTTANSSIQYQKQNVNFNILWSESYQDVGTYYRTLTKIDIIGDNKICYVVANGDGGSLAMQCYNKTTGV